MSLSNLFFQRYVENGASVVHFGSGDQSLKELIQPLEYVGVDITDDCDVKCDLNVEFPDFGKDDVFFNIIDRAKPTTLPKEDAYKDWIDL